MNPQSVRSIITDALIEIGVLSDGEVPSASLAQLGLRRFQQQIDTWAADRLTLSLLLRTPFTLPSNTNTITIGPGGTVNIQRPTWVNALNYVVPGTVPAVEEALGPMDADSYANLSIKGLTNALPTLYFYQTNLTDALGSLFVWPTPIQNITLVLYAPQSVGVPATLDDLMQGPVGYAEAFMYQLAVRLCTPLGRVPPALLPGLATQAYARMKRVNVQPGLLGVDQALVPSIGAGYNVLTDNTNAGQSN